MTAARLHGMWLPAQPDEVQLATCSGGQRGRDMSRARRPQFISHRRQLPIEDRTVTAGLPTTTAARTWRDLAVHLSLPDLVAAGDSVLRAGATTTQLAEVVTRTRAERGVRRAPRYACSTNAPGRGPSLTCGWP